MPRIVFTPSGRTGEVAAGTTVLEAALAVGADLDSVCSGRGLCGRCQIVPSEGSFAKWSMESGGSSLAPVGETEVNYHGARPLAAGARLGCMARIDHDVVVDVPPMSQRHSPVVRKRVDIGDLTVDPRFRLAYVELDREQFEQGRSVLDQMRWALKAQHGVEVGSVSYRALPMLHEALEGEELTATVALRGSELVAAWPGFVDTAYGVAVDLGSTTIAANLCDLFSGEVIEGAGVMNPQIRLGEDLMSRVSYVMMNPGGDVELSGLAREAIDGLVGDLSAAAEIGRDRILEIVVVGNPIMGHLLLGIDPTPLGQAPFPLATDTGVNVAAPVLAVDAPVANLYLLPNIAGHVGADTAGVILSEGPHRGDDVQLLVDVGTNAEIVLGCRDWMLAASSPTGPAFEGAQISCGQRATTGAIERIRIAPETLEPRYQIIGSDLWSDEAGFAEVAEELGVTGVCGSGIIEVVASMYLAGVIDPDGVIRPNETSGRIVADGRTYSYRITDGPDPLMITQNDVRAIQLAKAALRAGIDLLIARATDEFGLGSKPLDVRLAGAFGAHIDPLYAMVLGLVPPGPLESIRSVGNAAGAGAVRALLSAQQRSEIESVVPRVIKIETATEPAFQDLFVAAMAFPHASAAPGVLAELVELPAPVPPTPSDRPRRRRRPNPPVSEV